MKATGVVVSHSREKNIPIVIATMLAQPFINEVIVWDNNPTHAGFPKWFSYTNRVTVIKSKDNMFTGGRYAAAALAKNDTIATCDDDYLVSNWHRIWELYCRHSGLVVTMPSTDMLTPFLGWGSIFNRRRATYALAKYADKFGMDEIYYRKADRIFTLQQNSVVTEVEKPIPLPGYNTKSALYRQHEHNALNAEVEARVAQL